MTYREQVEKEGYKINPNGVITSFGKFEGEMYYAHYFYDFADDGEILSSMEDSGEYVSLVEIDDDNRKQFPELWDQAKYIGVVENDQGFVSISELTGAMADNWRAQYAPDEEE